VVSTLGHTARCGGGVEFVFVARAPFLCGLYAGRHRHRHMNLYVKVTFFVGHVLHESGTV